MRGRYLRGQPGEQKLLSCCGGECSAVVIRAAARSDPSHYKRVAEFLRTLLAMEPALFSSIGDPDRSASRSDDASTDDYDYGDLPPIVPNINPDYTPLLSLSEQRDLSRSSATSAPPEPDVPVKSDNENASSASHSNAKPQKRKANSEHHSAPSPKRQKRVELAMKLPYTFRCGNCFKLPIKFLPGFSAVSFPADRLIQRIFTVTLDPDVEQPVVEQFSLPKKAALLSCAEKGSDSSHVAPFVSVSFEGNGLLSGTVLCKCDCSDKRQAGNDIRVLALCHPQTYQPVAYSALLRIVVSRDTERCASLPSVAQFPDLAQLELCLDLHH